MAMGEKEEGKAEDVFLREGTMEQEQQKQKQKQEGWLWLWWRGSRSRGSFVFFLLIPRWRFCIFCILPIALFLFTFLAISAPSPLSAFLFSPLYAIADLDYTPSLHPPSSSSSSSNNNSSISSNLQQSFPYSPIASPSADPPSIFLNVSDAGVSVKEEAKEEDEEEEESRDGLSAESPESSISQNVSNAGVLVLEEEGEEGDALVAESPETSGGRIPAMEGSGPSSSPSWVARSVERCDVWDGMWVEDGENYPLYSPSACPYVDEAFGCQENGRPDADYLKWRWQPRHCILPRFDAQRMLEKLRGRRVVFAGDSLMRNQWESLLCLLREGLSNKSRMFELRGHRITKGKGSYIFEFLDYHARVEFHRSHFLVAEGKGRTNAGKQRLTLKIDTIERTAKRWKQADVLVFTTGHWWNHAKTSKGKDYFQEGNMVYPSLPTMVAFKKAMTTWASWVDKNIDPKRTKVFFSGYSPSHFHGGQWDSGGQCNNEKDLIRNDSYIPSYPEKMLVIEDVISHMKIPVLILNITRLSEYRKDAHPSIFGQVPQNGRSRRQDCSHWCLPGLPDIWNEVLYAFM